LWAAINGATSISGPGRQTTYCNETCRYQAFWGLNWAATVPFFRSLYHYTVSIVPCYIIHLYQLIPNAVSHTQIWLRQYMFHGYSLKYLCCLIIRNFTFQTEDQNILIIISKFYLLFYFFQQMWVLQIVCTWRTIWMEFICNLLLKVILKFK